MNEKPEPPKQIVRRDGLYRWLKQVGFTIQDVNALIDAGTIPKTHYPRKRRKKKAAPKAAKQRPKPEETPVLIKGRAWYNTREIANILKISLL
jgi:hypothetical protein